MQAKSFQRAFPNREFARGRVRWVWLCSIVGSVLLCAFLFNIFLIADLLDTRGRLEIGKEHIAELERLAGSLDEMPRAVTPSDVTFEDSGILPTIWSNRNRYTGQWLGRMYQRFGILHEKYNALLLLVVSSAAIGLLRRLLLSYARKLSNQVGINLATRMRKSLHRQAMRLGPSDLQHDAPRQVLILFAQDAGELQHAVSCWVRGICKEPVEILFLITLALIANWWVTVQCLIPILACWYVIKRGSQRTEQAQKLTDSRAEDQLKLLEEGFSKARLVRGYGLEQYEHDQFQKHLDHYNADLAVKERTLGWLRWGTRLLLFGCLSMILYFMAVKVFLPPEMPGSLAFSKMLMLIVIFLLIYRSVNNLWELPATRNSAALAADRIYRYLDRIPEVGQAVGAKFLQPLEKTLQFEAVSYTLPNRKKLLNAFDMKLSAGGNTAFVSLDPLEARAAAYLLPRYIEPQTGRVLFDGEDIAWVTLESLRAETIYVGGSDPCFTGSVFDNISGGSKEYSKQAVTEASKKTHAHNFIVKLPQGYETMLGEHGEMLSAGERFRLSLARAILRKPALLIIDEPDESLDEDTKSMVDDAYNRIVNDRTVIFLPKRLSTLRRADQIVLIHKGKVEAVGEHEVLIRQSALYRHWEYIKYNEFRHDLVPV